MHPVGRSAIGGGIFRKPSDLSGRD